MSKFSKGIRTVKLDLDLLEMLPDVLSKEQVRMVGHMSKRTATYLLESRILLAKHTSKKTKCYFIKKSDVIELFDDMAKNPDKYATPPSWYSEKKKIKAKPYKLRFIPSVNIDKDDLRQYYEKLIEPYGEVLTVMQLSAITGYRSTTVTSWIRTEKLESLQLLNRYIIPKSFALEWLTSDLTTASSERAMFI